jgi:hypothetical protein
VGVTLAVAAVGIIIVAVVVFVATRSNGGHAPAAVAVTSTTTTAPRAGKVVFTDDFTNNTSGWAPDAGQDGAGTAAYQSDGYDLTVLKPLPALNTYSAASPYLPKLTNMQVTVHATFVTALPADGAGVRCDQGSRNGLRYTFELFGSGMWVIFKIDTSGSTALASGSSAATPIGTEYTIAGQCSEVANGATTLSMTLNGMPVATVTDAHGGAPIGWNAALVAYRSASSPATVVRFNRFQTVDLTTR